MAEKGWLGADLIFDLDGDHLPGVSDNDFPAMIDVIQGKPEAMERISGTGIRIQAKIRTIHIFRASRFHIHLRDPSLLHLDSNARREIVNYIRERG